MTVKQAWKWEKSGKHTGSYSFILIFLNFLDIFRAGNNEGGRGGIAALLFCVAERIKGNRKKRKSFKAETVKKLLPRSKCNCFSHSRASGIQKFFLSANSWPTIYFSVHGLSTLKSISPALIYLSVFGKVLISSEEIALFFFIFINSFSVASD